VGEGEEEVARWFPVQGEEGTRLGRGAAPRHGGGAGKTGRGWAGPTCKRERERGKGDGTDGYPSGPWLGQIRPGRVISFFFFFSITNIDKYIFKYF
jgi:hypothetical protein